MDSFDQFLHDWLLITGTTGEAVFKLLVAAAAGGLVGLERELRGREAGFRTNLLVCLGSALVMVVSIQFASSPWMPTSAYNINVDPARLAYSVMTGVGFLGAGAILKHDTSVRGLTTAASLWCVAAIGLASGFGMYSLALLSAVLVVGALWFLNFIEARLPRARYRQLTIRASWRETLLAEFRKRCEMAGIQIIDLSYERKPEIGSVDMHLLVSFTDAKDHRSLEERLQADPEFTLIASERA